MKGLAHEKTAAVSPGGIIIIYFLNSKASRTMAWR
jgi:hypothetical protein